MQQTEDIVDLLQQFGLSPKEAKVYLASLALGPSSVQNLSRLSKVNRATVHIICDKLKEKRILAETRQGKKRLLFAEEPEKIKTFIEDEKSQLQLMENALEILIPKIQDFRSNQKTSDKRPNVRFYEGIEGFAEVCERSLNKAKNEILFASSLDSFRDIINPDYDLGYYIPTRVKKGIRMKALLAKTKITKTLQTLDKNELRETRFIPKKFNFKSTIFIYENEFSMITSQAPFIGIVAQSKELTETMRQMFKFIWNCADRK